MPTGDFATMNFDYDDRIAALLHKKLVGETLLAEEQQLLEDWASQSADNAALLNKIQNEASVHKMLQTWYNIEQNREENKGRFFSQLAALSKESQQPKFNFFKSRIVRYAAAAVVLMGVSTYALLHSDLHQPATRKVVALKETTPIAPGRDGAILTLADGSQLVLDSAGNGVVASQNGANVVLQNGQLTYNAADLQPGEIVYNNVRTPKGRQFKLVLPDGTKVWLNAASSIKYPTAFSGKERHVELQGEAYFEVAQNEQLPFKVQTGEATEIQVLGTSFNINAYTNEHSIRTTLLEGAVRINAYSHTATLKPGQQAAVKPQLSQMVILNAVDTDQILAWKNGLFNFENASLDEIMRQLERWYDIEVVYEKGIPAARFGGWINKQNTLQDVLQILESSNVHFHLEGRKLIVMP
ncbi:FecR family protein [Chitinophaga skermanii]|uniref:FecR family protein n=1 Tax=Chitinophaga skermanii TaxID=331697 RepID=A0A327QWA0_9BACT|nr:FecR family protein [Chitinophaga skermanii]RAJ08630.1 FecR family protein [Chitinophaga skermanii]